MAKGEVMRGKRLTRETANEIRFAQGPQKTIAHRFGISQAHVCRIKNGTRRTIDRRVNQAHITSAMLATLAFTGAA